MAMADENKQQDDDLGPVQGGPYARVVPPSDDDLGPIAGQPSPKEPDTSAIKKYVSNNMAVYQSSQKDGSSANPKKNYADGFGEAFLAGLSGSTAGLSVHGAPTTVLPENAGRAVRIVSQAGQMLGDAPEFIAASMAAGGPLNPVGALAAGFAAVQGTRKLLMDHYEKGDIKSPSDFVDRLVGAGWEAAKGAITGAATAVTGGAVGPVLGTAGAAAAELATMTTVGAGLEGRLPTADEFVDGALLIGGIHALPHVVPKLRNIYAKTEMRPADIVNEASKNVEMKQDLLSPDPNVPGDAQPTELKQTLEEKQAGIKNDGQPQEAGPKELKTELVPKENPEEAPPEPSLEDKSPEEKEILSKIGVSAEAEKKSYGEKFDDWYARNIDYLDPIKSALIEAKKNGAEIINNAYESARRFSAHTDTVRSVLEFGTRDGKTGEINGEGLNTVLKDIPKSGGDLDGFRAYGIAERALELNDRGITPYEDFNKETAQRVVGDGREKYAAINQRRIEFENRVLDYAKAKGLISADQLESIKILNEKHFPLNRVQDPDFYTGNVRGGAALKRIYGSDLQILDPILQTYKNTEALIKRSMINEIRNSFVKSMRDGGLIEEGGKENPEAYLSEVKKNLIPIEASAEEVTRGLRKQGLLAPDFEQYSKAVLDRLPNATEEQIQKSYDKEFGNMDSVADAITIFRPEKTFLKDNQIQIMVDGKPKIYEGAPGVIDSLKRMDGDFTSIDTWSKIMRGFANATRVGVIANPGFGFSHFFRSQIMSSVYSETGMVPFFHSAMALKELMGKSSKDYQDWVYHGGASSSWLRIDDNYLKDNAIEANEKQAPTHGRAWNAVHTAMEATEAFIKLTDNASRFSEYKRSVATGSSPEQAAFRSREVVPDYQKVGLERSALRTSVAFIGAHINSLDRMKQAFQDDPKSTIAKLSAISAVSAMLWAANKDDEAINSLPSWQKDQYWNFNLTRISGGGGTNQPATILRLPKPWAPGVLFGSGVEVALDAFSKEQPNRVHDFIHTLTSSVVPEPIPNIAQPILEQWRNKNNLSGRPLVNEGLEKQLPEMQYQPYTSEAAKQIAKIIGYVPFVRDVGPAGSNVPLQSPIVVENYIHTWGGTAGGWALKIADTLINQERRNTIDRSNLSDQEKYAKIAALSVDKAEPWQNKPIVHSFFTRYPSFNDQNVADFYKNKDETDRVMTSLKAASKRGDIEAAQRIANEHPDLMLKLEKIAKGISTAKQTYSIMQDDPKLEPVQKRQILDTLMFQTEEMAKYGNKMLSDFKKRSVVH